MDITTSTIKQENINSIEETMTKYFTSSYPRIKSKGCTIIIQNAFDLLSFCLTIKAVTNMQRNYLFSIILFPSREGYPILNSSFKIYIRLT